jgi:hypothetical protein
MARGVRSHRGAILAAGTYARLPRHSSMANEPCCFIDRGAPLGRSVQRWRVHVTREILSCRSSIASPIFTTT